jgi:hypothetical protein
MINQKCAEEDAQGSVLTEFKLLSRYFTWRAEKNEESPAGIVSVPAETGLSNKSQQRHRSNNISEIVSGNLSLSSRAAECPDERRGGDARFNPPYLNLQ